MTDDTINRQMAIKAIEDLQDCYNGFSDTYDKACIIGVLEELPSAQPERKTGRWIIYEVSLFDGGEDVKCSECGQCGCDPYWNFCPNCGARMVECERSD